MPSAPSPPAFLQSLLAEEALRGERRAYMVRWCFSGVAGAALVVMLLLDRYPTSGWWGLGMLGVAAIYNIWLGLRLRSGRLSNWFSYLSATIDILLITAYNYITSVYSSPLAVSASAAMAIYYIVLISLALRHNKPLLFYGIIFTLFCMNGAYYLRYPDLDKIQLAGFISSDPIGMGFRSLYILFFGGCLFFVPQAVTRLARRQAAMFEERQAAEQRHSAELESQVAARTAELEQANQKLQTALDEVKALSGLLPICTSCKKIRDDQGYWQGVEDYIREHSQADFTHGICPDCMAKIYPEVYERLKARLPAPGQEVPALAPHSPKEEERP